MSLLEKNYDPKEAEPRLQKFWAEKGVYAWDPAEPRERNYVIDTPPPTVSGLLHMGHIFSYTQADFIARYQRMKGMNVFYPMGFDDNGLPTERLVEKAKKIRAADVGREKFIELCNEVAEEARVEFRALFESVALSVDWAQEYHTISEDSRRISQMSFLDLHAKGHIYRALEPMLWDPIDQTAIAQAEVEDKELPSFWNDILFGIDGSDEKITIGTTRPELLPACVAVLYHPEDERYQHLKNKTAITPLFGVKVPLIADDLVQKDKGTGLVMCCTFGDETDIAWFNKYREAYNLKIRVILNKYGKIKATILTPDDTTTEEWIISFGWNDGLTFGPDYGSIDSSDSVDLKNAIRNIEVLNGLKVTNSDPKHPGAREKITELLQQQNLLVKREPMKHAVKCAERSGAPLEILPTAQWFVKLLDKKDALLKRAKEANWYPEYMRVRMEQWTESLKWDWCISRQRYFGVPFPVWYFHNEDGGIIQLPAHINDLPVNPLKDLPRNFKLTLENDSDQAIRGIAEAQEDILNTKGELVIRKGTRGTLKAEPDVMDTWATSSVSPQLNSHGVAKNYTIDKDRHEKLFPADLRPQAHEIIRTWAFYTFAKAELHEQTIPWKNLMISGWCLASDKTKMSKSKGNVITPVALIQEKGADAVRYWASTSRLGADTAFSEDVLKIGRKLVTKLWNASKFAAQHLDKRKGEISTARDDKAITETLDRWIITRLSRAVTIATDEFERYEYSDARAAMEDFFWNDFCDNYLELCKARAYDTEGKNSAAQQSAIHTIYYCLEVLLRLFAPIVPHITEELYQDLFGKNSVHSRGMWPKAEILFIDEVAENSGIAAVSVMNEVRKVKAEKNVSIKWPVEKIEVRGKVKLLEPVLSDLKDCSNAREISLSEADGDLHAQVTLGEQSDAA